MQRKAAALIRMKDTHQREGMQRVPSTVFQMQKATACLQCMRAAPRAEHADDAVQWVIFFKNYCQYLWAGLDVTG
jgi:hypothetical protein